MAKISFPDTAMGTTFHLNATFSKRRIPAEGLQTNTMQYVMDGFTTFPVGMTSADSQVEVVSESVCPASATVNFTVGDSGYRVSTDRDAARFDIKCDSRWIAKDASATTGQLLWSAMDGREPFDLVSTPEGTPKIIDDSSYRFYDSISNSWAPSSAVSFTGDDFAESEPGVWASDPARDGGFGMLGVWVLNDVAGEMPIMQFAYRGPSFGVYLDRNNNLVLKYGDTYRSAIKMLPGWFSVPIRIGLFFLPGWNVVAVNVKAGGVNSEEKSASLPVTDLASVVTSQIGLMWGPSEDSCELLDLSVWRRKLDGKELAFAKGAYTMLYGV